MTFSYVDQDSAQDEPGESDEKKISAKDAAHLKTSHISSIDSAVAKRSNRRKIAINIPISSVFPDRKNKRIGQNEMDDQFEAILFCVKKLSVGGALPEYSEVVKDKDFPELGISAMKLFEGIYEFAENLMANNGIPDTPITVLTEDENQKHKIKTGHRRFFATRIASCACGIENVDVLIEKDSKYNNSYFELSVSRVAENAVKKENSTAELIEYFLEYTDEDIGTHESFSKKIGIERTRVSRLISIAKNLRNGDNNIIIQKIHECEIEDTQSLQILFSKNRDEWNTLLDELDDIGPTKFRDKYRQSIEVDGNKNEGVINSGQKPKNKTILKIKSKQKPAILHILLAYANMNKEIYGDLDSLSTEQEKLDFIASKTEKLLGIDK